MTTLPLIWKEQRLIESFEVDRNGRLKPHMLFGYLLNSAWRHATGTDLGYRELSDRNLMWVLAKFQLSVVRVPNWGEQIMIETWGKGFERFHALRDFVVTSSKGEKLASASSAWMILEKNRHRPQLLEPLKGNFPSLTDRSEMTMDLKKVPDAPGDNEMARFRALFSDIDVNNHVTALRYVQWIIDSYPAKIQEESFLNALEISYLEEAVLEDEVVVFSGLLNGEEICTVKRARDRKELCRAKIRWKSMPG